MVKITKKDGNVIVSGDGNTYYPFDGGVLTFPLNSIIAVTDDSDMVTFRSKENYDIFFAENWVEIEVDGYSPTSKKELAEKFSELANAVTGGGGGDDPTPPTPTPTGDYNVAAKQLINSSLYSSITEVDASGWDLSNVQSLNSTFSSLSNLEKIVGLKDCDTSNVSNWYGTFQACNKLANLNDIEKWNVSKGGSMQNMMRQCKELETFDMSNWDINKVTTMQYMFYGCNKLKEVTITPTGGADNILNFAYTFKDCTSLTDFTMTDLEFPKLQSFMQMFRGCFSLENVEMSNLTFKNTTSHIVLNAMFYDCTSLTEFGGSSWYFEDGTNVELKSMFYNCQNLKQFDMLGVNLSVSDFGSMFYNCQKLERFWFGTWDVSSIVYLDATIFQHCYELSDVKGTLKGVQFSLNLGDCPLTRNSALVFLNGLKDLTGSTAKTITFKASTVALLSDADKAIATNKNWNIASA